MTETSHSFHRSGWLIYRMKGPELEIYGVVENEAKAREEATTLDGLLAGAKWEMKQVWFIGWGLAMPVSNDDKAGSSGAN